jgi:hypothetical protein
MWYPKWILIVVFSPVFVLAQSSENEQKLSSEIEKVTVFLEGAQVERTAQYQLPAGKTTLVLEKLSPFMDPQSISVKGTGNFVVLGVNHRRNFLEKEQRTQEIEELLLLRETVNDSIILEQQLLAVWSEEDQFLRENRNIKGNDTGYELEDLQSIGTYYVERMRTIKREQILGQRRITKMQERLSRIDLQVAELQGKKDFGWSEIVIQVEANNRTTANFAVTYLTGNTGWFPTYDLWVASVEEDVELVYQANLRQDTREDWVDVQLAFSNAEPNQSGQAPSLFPYFLSFQNYYPQQRTQVIGSVAPNRTYSTLRGRVTDNYGEPLIGASIWVPGTSIGTVSDMDGRYELTLPVDATIVEISYIGFVTQQYGLGSSSILDVTMAEGNMVLEEVMVTGTRGRPKMRRDRSLAPPSMVDGVNPAPPPAPDAAVPTQTIEYTTSVEFLLDIPYTIRSSNETVKIDLTRLEVPASYEYTTVPKLDENAYLLATVTDWEQYNLLEGEVSLHFENTYVGKSILDVRYATDTLLLSLGRDQGLSVERESVQDYTKRTFLGGKKIERRHYRTTIRNTKRYAVRIVVRDQIPLSTNKDIEVESLELSGGQLNVETGEITWEVEIPAGRTVTLENQYEVKYPKDQYLRIE